MVNGLVFPYCPRLLAKKGKPDDSSTKKFKSISSNDTIF